MSIKYYIFPYNWWPGFTNKQDANHIGFFEILFSKTCLNNFEITYDINKANVLLEAGNPDLRVHNIKKWLYKINFIGEPAYPDYNKYDLVLTSINNIKNIVDLPLCIMYTYCNNFLPKLYNQPYIKEVPSNFCCFIVSNPKCEIRNKIFDKINKYKKVDSMGRYNNNIGTYLNIQYWSNNFHKLLSNYKFMICCENTKMETYSTEKIINPFIAKTIPIYWGTHNIKNIFNERSMLFLEDETDESFDKLINRVIELDSDDNKYLDFINQPNFTNDNIKFWNDNYSFESISKKIDNILNEKLEFTN